MDFYYINSQNEKINFVSDGYMAQTTDLLDYEWSHTMKDERIQSIKRKAKTAKIIITISAKVESEYYSLLNQMVDVFDYDNNRNQRGKLHINDYYLHCNIIASEKKEWEYMNTFMDVTLKVLIGDPSWMRVNMFSYYPVSDSKLINTKRYTYAYPYRYGGEGGKSTIYNDSVSEADILLSIYGPVASPTVNIGGNIYSVSTIIETDERLEINTTDRTIFLIKIDGSKINQFEYRNQSSGNTFFKRVAPGITDIFWNNSFSFDVYLFKKRSEPKWR